MSIRTDADEVAAILAGYTIESGALDSFITSASLWVDNYLDGVCTLTPADKLQTIEAYIAAHLYTLSQGSAGTAGPVVAKKIEGIETRYGSSGNEDTAGANRFIHIAAAFDRCGIVAEQFLGKPRLRYYVGAGYDDSHTGGGG